MTTFAKLQEAMDRQRQLWEKELQKLSENPELADYAQAFMDGIWRDLNYLCHYTQATDGHGKLHSMNEVHSKLKDLFSETYLQLTGLEYRPKVCRAVEDRERKENDAESS